MKWFHSSKDMLNGTSVACNLMVTFLFFSFFSFFFFLFLSFSFFFFLFLFLFVSFYLFFFIFFIFLFSLQDKFSEKASYWKMEPNCHIYHCWFLGDIILGITTKVSYRYRNAVLFKIGIPLKIASSPNSFPWTPLEKKSSHIKH